jgi:hypothetical protein
MAEVARLQIVLRHLHFAPAVEVDDETPIPHAGDPPRVPVEKAKVVPVAVRQDPVADGEADIVDPEHLGAEASGSHEGVAGPFVEVVPPESDHHHLGAG